MNPTHLKVETPDPTPKGGQHTGAMPKGVKVTHVPTGLVAFCDYERSQFKNRNIAMAMIEYGLAEIGWVEEPQHRHD